ncbi:MAG: inositol monophosphatase family protein [Candidatus Jordarchaeales archaeon]
MEELVIFLDDILERLREKLLSEWRDEGGLLGFNVKGDETRAFDITAEKFLINEIKERLPNAAFFAEEEGEIRGEGPFFILDPVDGSTNFLRKIGVCSVSIAVADEPYIEKVNIGMVKNLISGDIYVGVRGVGAFLNGKRIRVSSVMEPREAVIGVDLDFPDKNMLDKVLPLIKSVKKIRKIGTNALEISYVAHGGLDAFVDIRGVLTCESFLGAKVILEEAGGIITDENGKEIKGKIDLSERWSIIAAGNRVLHEKICSILRGK